MNTQYFEFTYYFDSGSAESGPKLSSGSSQTIKAASLDEAWKKLQKNLKWQKKLYKKYRKQLRRDRKKINLPHWSWMSVIMHGPDRNRYTKTSFFIIDADALDWYPQQDNYELNLFYKEA